MLYCLLRFIFYLVLSVVLQHFGKHEECRKRRHFSVWYMISDLLCLNDNNYLLICTYFKNEVFMKPTPQYPQQCAKNQSNIQHTETKEVIGSHFKHHATKVTTIKESAAAKDPFFQLPTVAQCNNLIYAYSIIDLSGMKIQSNTDGGKWAASKLLANIQPFSLQ